MGEAPVRHSSAGVRPEERSARLSPGLWASRGSVRSLSFLIVLQEGVMLGHPRERASWRCS
jgi:hypothetical protein